MKEFKFFSYIKRYRAAILISSFIMGVLFYSYFSRKQSYTASTIIQYKNAEAVQGLAADGTEIDVTEIYSSEVMTKVFERLGISYGENNMDAIRANVRVDAVKNKEEATVQEALNEKGEVVQDKPTMYRVSYTVGSGDAQNAAAFSKQILQTMLNVYVETYAKNHVNSGIPLYSVGEIYEKDYDYIEMAEILDSAIQQALTQLSYKTSASFRAASTGYSFSDLKREFSLLRDIDLPNTYAYILGNQITKDQDVLLSKYENRIKNSILQNDKSEAEAKGVDEIIASYVAMMRNSKNTDFTYEYILNEVYDENDYVQEDKKKRIEQTTEYDELLDHYVSERTLYEKTLIDIAYDQYILEVYSGNVNEENGVTVEVIEDPGQTLEAGATGSDSTALAATADQVTGFDVSTTIQQKIISSRQSQEVAYEMLKELTDRVEGLYQVTLKTNEEYNRFIGAKNIAILTDAVMVPALNLSVYAILAFVLFGIVGCVLSVLVGRSLEIFDYYVYVDRKLNIANRAGCDRYISKYERVLLPSDFVCIALKMLDIGEKNQKYGREQCDEMMRDFCKILNEILPSRETFAANNGLGQFVIFLQNSDRDQAHAYVHEIGERCVSYNKEKECKISYACGISVSGRSQIYTIRELMIDSMKKASKTVIRKIS